ncbi:MAG: hypothetical protein ACRDDZ_06200 [Marinifilaceae bacterium]
MELRASEAFLDLGVKVPLHPIRFLSKKKRKRFKMYRPTTGGLLRISRLYLTIGLKYEDIKDYGPEENMKLMVDHGKAISKMVALSICRGYLSGMLFSGIVAWWLRWRCHPLVLQEAWYIFIGMVSESKSFQNIIKSAQTLNLMAPRMSREKKGS